MTDEITMGDLPTGPKCPHCSIKLNTFTGFNGAEPKPGDFTLCYYCNEISVYDGEPDALILRLATDAELAEVTEKLPRVTRLVRAFKDDPRIDQLIRDQVKTGPGTEA